MKAIITANMNGVLADHLSFCPFVTKETDDVKTIDVNTLSIDKYVDDGELEELIVEGILDCVPITQAMNIIKSLVRKIRHGGVIIITGIDAYLVAKAFVEIRITIEKFNVLMHGTDQDLQKTLNLTCSGVAHFLSEAGLKVVNRRIDNFQYSVKALRQ